MWLVTLLHPPKQNPFRSNFFPRKTYYKKDAIKLQKEVSTLGGEAIIFDLKRQQPIYDFLVWILTDRVLLLARVPTKDAGITQGRRVPVFGNGFTAFFITNQTGNIIYSEQIH